jgi:propanol-preferring alcohol dehydrogenase
MDVIAMARDGLIHPEGYEFPLDRAVEVHAKLKAGEIRGRAVLVPE